MKRSRARSPATIEFARRERAAANEFAHTVWQRVRNRQICKPEVSPRICDTPLQNRRGLSPFLRSPRSKNGDRPLLPGGFVRGSYTADFCSIELNLILEVDGNDHLTEVGRQRDRVRDDFLNRQGYRVVRISGYEVLREPVTCRTAIVEQVQQRMREMENPSPPATHSFATTVS